VLLQCLENNVWNERREECIDCELEDEMGS